MAVGAAYEIEKIAFDLFVAKLDVRERDDFLQACRDYLVSRRAYFLWVDESRRMGGIVHGQREWHWDEASRAFEEVNVDGKPSEEELAKYFLHLAISERAYNYFLDRRNRGWHSTANGTESDWYRAEQEVLREFAAFAECIEGGGVTKEKTYELHWLRLRRHSDGSRMCEEPTAVSNGESVFVREGIWQGVHMLSEKIRAAIESAKKSKDPFDGMSFAEVSAKYAGKVLACAADGHIIMCSDSEEKLREKMKDYEGYWEFDPGWPKNGPINLEETIGQ